MPSRRLHTIPIPKLFMQHIWAIFENTHTCVRIAIEINEKEYIQDIFIDISSFFTRKNSQEWKQRSLTEIYEGNVYIFFPLGSHSECLSQFYEVLFPDTFISFAMQNPRRLFIFSCVLKPYKLEVAFIGEILVFFILLNEHFLS